MDAITSVNKAIKAVKRDPNSKKLLQVLYESRRLLEKGKKVKQL